MRLSSQSIQVLEELREQSPRTVEDLEKEGYDQSMVHRAAMELEEKGIVNYREEEEVEWVITPAGEEVIQEGSPEHQLIERLADGAVPLSELEDLDLDVALGKAREKGWVRIKEGEVSLTEQGRQGLGSDRVQNKLKDQEYDEEVRERGLVAPQERTERILDLTGEGEAIDTGELGEEFNVEARVKTPRTGKKHFYREIMDYARRVWKDMGFEEMSGDYVTSGLMNFDALYIPQDHPARELQDSFFMETPAKTDLSIYGGKVQEVKDVHEFGGDAGGKGWQYDWSREDAERNVLRTHTTDVSAKRLHEMEINEEELPKKFFCLGRAFRNETVDRTHNAEFYQTDGIVVGKDLSFRNLKGYLSEFFEKMGYSEFRLIPSYYPYTEMSVEVQVWDDEDEEWLGMGGAGMFRPEVVKPMLGFEATVLAWGLGIGRIAMINAELNDIRELYRNDIEILEQTPVWRPDQ